MTIGTRRTIDIGSEVLPFYCPVPPMPSLLRGDVIDSRAVEWMLALGLCEPGSPVTRIDVGTFITLCYPYCSSESLLDIAADLNYLGFVFDDEHVTDPSLRTCAGLAPAIGALLAVLDSPEAPVEDRYQRALRDIIVRLAAVTTPGNVVCAADGLRKALLYTLWQMSTWERHETPDLNNYITMRINDDGAPWFNAFVPVCSGYELAGAALRSPPVRALSQSVALAAGIDNDIFSFHREHLVGQKNILDILMRDHQLPAADAMQAAIALRNRVMHLYGRLRDNIVGAGDPTLSRYARDIGHVVRGNLVWSHYTTRYRTGARSAALDLTSQTTTIDPDPIPLPAIRWWWDLL